MLENAPTIVVKRGDASIASRNSRIERELRSDLLEPPHAAVVKHGDTLDARAMHG